MKGDERGNVDTQRFAAALVLVLPTAAATPQWSGKWKTTLNYWRGSRTLTLNQKGTAVTGRHGLTFLAETVKNGVLLACGTKAGGTIKGTARRRKLTGTITFPNAKGAIYLKLSPSGRRMTGEMHVLRGECATAWGAFEAVRT